MKRPHLIIAVILSACSVNDSMYEGPAINSKCALEVFPPNVVKAPDSIKAPEIQGPKPDPLIRQNGIMVCRSF